MNVGGLIHQKRIENGLTLAELANRVGVSHVSVLRWERNDTKSLKNDKCVLLAKALNISPLELLDSPTEQEQSMIYQFRSLTEVNKNVVTTLIKSLLDGQK